MYLTCTYVLFRFRVGVAPCLSYSGRVRVVIVNVLCCQFLIFKDRSGGVVLSGVQFA
jgi:hypothetical protein